MSINKRISIPHYDSCPYPSLYYEAIKNSSQQFKDEIYDIYFGKIFTYKYQAKDIYDNHEKSHEVVYGNVMGVEASDEQLDYLFKIQTEFGIEISLTINQLDIPVEIFYSNNNRVLDAFLYWLQELYDRGLRSCTLANNHLMRTGILQKRFPDMKWKNTVNHQVSTPQQVIDYLYLGYNIIQLDRSLNRNLNELKIIKEIIENFKNKYPDKYVKTCMLVWEDCMPSCPFKREHDYLQIHHNNINYWNNQWGALSCRRWRTIFGERVLPRAGTNCCWVSVDTFKEYAELVDIFKYSGRLTVIGPNPSLGKLQAAWSFLEHYGVNSLSEIIENKLEPIHLWCWGIGVFADLKTRIEDIKEGLKDNLWLTEEGRRLEKILKECENQCYRCHQCEKFFGLSDIDTLIEI